MEWVAYRIVLYCSPISIALYLKKEDWETFMTVKSQMGLEERVSIALYLQTDSSLYPINALRNIAIQNVHTSHFFMSDMDMWPSFSLHDVLQSLPSYILGDDMFAGIIPAFEIEKPACSSLSDCVSKYFSKNPVDFRSVPQFPRSKPELIQCLKNQSCFLYREKKSTHVELKCSFSFRTISTKSGFFRTVRFIIRWFRAGSTRSKSPT